MKSFFKITITLVAALVLGVTANAQSMFGDMVTQKLFSERSTFDNFEPSLLVGTKYHSIELDSSFATLPSLEIGCAFARGGYDGGEACGVPLYGGWEYYAPYASLEYGFKTPSARRIGIGRENLIVGPKLNLSITAGTGFHFLIVPVSINASAAFATNFGNSGIEYNIGANIRRFSINAGRHAGLGGTKVGDSNSYIGATFILWDR